MGLASNSAEDQEKSAVVVEAAIRGFITPPMERRAEGGENGAVEELY